MGSWCGLHRTAGLHVAATVALLVTRASVARGDDSAAAQALFDQGKSAMAAHNYAEACAKFEDSLRLEYGLGTLLNLADCYEAQGKTASAWTKFLEVAAKARAAGQADRARIGRQRAAALASKLSNLVIDVPAAARVEGLVVARDGTATLPAEWGTAIPQDPGTHVISASAPGKKNWSTTVNVPREAATTHVEVPALAALPSEPVAGPTPWQPSPPTRAFASSPPPSSRPPHERSRLGIQRILGIASGVVGLAGVGVGTYFGLYSLAKHNDATRVCATTLCDTSQGVGLWHDATTAGNTSTVAFIVGAVGVGGGLALWLTAPGLERSGGPSAQIEIAPRMIRLRAAW
ncbi:MAG TPA: hypothetical protein VEK07_05580 [Polyangiaceae bacterium]|nr:hypothetical protein [Polyangiaceae bacterium]